MSRTIKLLLAEDEPSLGKIIHASLESKGFEVILCENGEEAYSKFIEEKPAMLILDIMMPKLDGLSLTKKIRKENNSIPILFLTAKSQVKDVVIGFKNGGNDYLKKPFAIDELVVRINALINRSAINDDITLIGQYKFDRNSQILTHNNNTISLTWLESELLFYLTQNKNNILDRTFILNKLWKDDDFFNRRSMDVYISKLRKKLANDPNIKILNIRGLGYKILY